MKEGSTPFVWNTKCDKAVESLKTAIMLAPIVNIVNSYKASIIECDFLEVALGSVLG